MFQQPLLKKLDIEEIRDEAERTFGLKLDQHLALARPIFFSVSIGDAGNPSTSTGFCREVILDPVDEPEGSIELKDAVTDAIPYPMERTVLRPPILTYFTMDAETGWELLSNRSEEKIADMIRRAERVNRAIDKGQGLDPSDVFNHDGGDGGGPLLN